MNFDIVIGNPPYDRTDIQMKFAINAFEIANSYSLMIIPAKWQCKGDKTKDRLYSTFREQVVPHMSDICYYNQCADVFDIIEPSGIAHYITHKTKSFDVKTITNKCVLNKKFNDIAIRRFSGGIDSLNNKGQTIIDKVRTIANDVIKPSSYSTNNQYQFWCNSLVCGGAIMSNVGRLQILSMGELNTLSDIKEGDQHNAYIVLFTSSSMKEVISFMSYAYTKFVRFLIFNSICGLSSTVSDTWWRFVPIQTFDHIFTDEELYKKYSLNEDDISIIESTIAERPLQEVISWIPQSLREIYNTGIINIEMD